MKNIILMGVPRSGKSTFARMIMDNFKNYSIVQDDVIESTYIDMCRHLADKNSIVEIELDLSVAKRMTKDCFENYIDYEPRLNYILDSSNLDIEEVLEYVEKGYIVIVFGYPNITSEEGVNNVLEYDQIYDWTYIEPVDRIRRLFDIYIKISKEYQDKCKEYNLKFVDTSKDREIVLNDLMKWLKECNE